MRTNCGLWRLPQENESSPVAFHPISVPCQSKFRDRNSEVQRYGPDHPMQSDLKNHLPVPVTPPSTPTHKHCITSAYGSHANPTSNHLASSQYESQWRSVARWETNGTDLSLTVPHADARPEKSTPVELLRNSVSLDETASARRLLPCDVTRELEAFYRRAEPYRQRIISLSKQSEEYGRIVATMFPHMLEAPDRNAESFPSSNAALPPQNVSHLHDISANPSWSPLSSSESLPPPPPMFPRPSNISENPEWSSLWLVQPPLREMVPLPTYQTPVVSANSGANVDEAQAINNPESVIRR